MKAASGTRTQLNGDWRTVTAMRFAASITAASTGLSGCVWRNGGATTSIPSGRGARSSRARLQGAPDEDFEQDRKDVGEGKRVEVRVNRGGRRTVKTKKNKQYGEGNV